jgi:hypothetical protein
VIDRVARAVLGCGCATLEMIWALAAIASARSAALSRSVSSITAASIGASSRARAARGSAL